MSELQTASSAAEETYGDVILDLRHKHGTMEADLAARVKRAQQRDTITPDTIAKWQKGDEAPWYKLTFERLADIVVDENPSILDPQKVQKRAAFECAWRGYKTEGSQNLFSKQLIECLADHNLPIREVAAEITRRINPPIEEPLEQIDYRLIGAIQAGRAVPSFGLSVAIEKAFDRIGDRPDYKGEHEALTDVERARLRSAYERIPRPETESAPRRTLAPVGQSYNPPVTESIRQLRRQLYAFFVTDSSNEIPIYEAMSQQLREIDPAIKMASVDLYRNFFNTESKIVYHAAERTIDAATENFCRILTANGKTEDEVTEFRRIAEELKVEMLKEIGNLRASLRTAKQRGQDEQPIPAG